MAKPRLQAVIFTLDGLLIDSEVLWNDVRSDLAEQRGVRWNADDHAAVMGVSAAQWTAYMIRRLGLELSPAELEELVSSRLAALYEDEIPYKPGAVALVQQLGAEFPLGLASGSRRSLIELVTSAPELEGRFAAVVSADEVARGKPAPDVYLEVARRLGVAPERCVCLEDSEHGVEAGKAAGMRVVAVTDPRFMPPAAALARADGVTDSLTKVTLALLEGDAGVWR